MVSVARTCLFFSSLSDNFTPSRSLQTIQPTEAQIKAFCELYAPSPHVVYNQAGNIDAYESKIVDMVKGLAFDMLQAVITGIAKGNLVGEISHHVFLVDHCDGNRLRPMPTIPTAHLTLKVMDAIKLFTSEEKVLFFRMLLMPSMMGLAGLILDQAMPRFLARGGTWPIIELKSEAIPFGGEFQHWKVPTRRDACVTKYMHIGYDDVRQAHNGKVLTIDSNANRASQAIIKVEVKNFRDIGGLKTNAYYRPEKPTQATFDGFVYDEVNRVVTVFQATVSPQHSVDPKGFKELRELIGPGCEIRYVLVTLTGIGVFSLDPYPNNGCLNDSLSVKEKYALFVNPTDIL